VDRAAEQLVGARFDLLYYWEVGTDLLNYLLPFYRAAPVQCAGWGWPVTTGIPQIDYFISCTMLEMDAGDAHYTEKLVRLAHLPTYYYRPQIPSRLRPRAQFGLNDADHLYLCAQNLRKLHPDFDRLLAAILRADPAGRVLLISDKQPEIAQLLRRRFQSAMPDIAARIQFLPHMAEADYLNVLALTDVALDTLYYGGGANTTYDAFAAGTPVVTLPTQFQRGRYAYAAYQQIGIHDAIAGSPEAYVAIALRLGTDRAARADLSARISAACPPLFEDTAAVTELADFFEQALDRARVRPTPQADHSL
jgi:protein O-GlcNAc transferase